MTTINDCYINFIDKILTTGKETYKDHNHHLKECIGNHYYIDNPLGLKYTVKYNYLSHNDLLEKIMDGEYDIRGSPIKSDALYEYVKSFEDACDNGFVYTYPNRIREHFNVDQFNIMKERLCSSLGSNRAVSVTYDPVLDSSRGDIPCLQLLQATIRGNKLCMHCFFRSNDIYGAFYSNMYLITYIGLKLRDELNNELRTGDVGFGGVYYYSSSAHIYSNDLGCAESLVNNLLGERVVFRDGFRNRVGLFF